MNRENIAGDRIGSSVVNAATKEMYYESQLPSHPDILVGDPAESPQGIAVNSLAREVKAIQGLNEIDARDKDDWRNHARCLGVDPNEFYSVDGAGVEAAQAICALCEVRIDCLEFALNAKTRQEHGVWGGASERERRRILRRRRDINNPGN